MDNSGATVLGAVKGVAYGFRRGAFGICESSSAPWPPEGVRAEGVPSYRPRLRRVEQKAAQEEAAL